MTDYEEPVALSKSERSRLRDGDRVLYKSLRRGFRDEEYCQLRVEEPPLREADGFRFVPVAPYEGRSRFVNIDGSISPEDGEIFLLSQSKIYNRVADKNYRFD
jgi:hypothetical protein